MNVRSELRSDVARHETEVVVAMWILCGATGIDDVDVRRHLIHGAEPGFRS